MSKHSESVAAANDETGEAGMTPKCYNREPWLTTLVVKDGMSTIMSGDKGVAAYKVKEIPFVGSNECHVSGPSCGDCVWLPPKVETTGVQ